jgi:predicted unusual protein kinase regulating ubiquinone biosynthesis (AarF/ABC1/UbiB family)
MRRKMPGINRISQFIRFLRVSKLLLWTIWVIYRERKRVIRARAHGHYEVQPDIDILIKVLTEFRHTAIKLGVLMIKLGQFLSSRADLLPERALAVLASLQDEVPPEPFSHVVEVVEEELGQPIHEIFSSFERKCTAAASLGQVHKAVLISTGETVAVKVQRPYIQRLIHMDLSSLRFVIWIITRLFDTGNFIDLWGIYREFRRTVYEEADFAREANNAKRFAEMFRDSQTIYIPKVYEEYVTRKVIVLEWVDGIKINDYTTLDAAGINRLEVANRTIRAYFHQFFEVGFFHADPHPGNIFVKQGSPPQSPVIAFLDFGMVGSITRNMKKLMRELFIGMVTRDAHMLVTALEKLGFIGDGANIASIERAVSLLMEQYYGLTLGQLHSLDMQDVAQDLIDLLYGQPFHIPAQFAFTGRAVGTLVGVTTGLAPDFNFIETATPYAKNFLGLDAKGTSDTIQELLRQVIESARIATILPRSVERLITRIETGQVEVRLTNQTPNTTANGIKGNQIPLILMFLGSLGGGVYLTKAQRKAPAWFCLGLAGLTAVGSFLRKSERRGSKGQLPLGTPLTMGGDKPAPLRVFG